MKIALRGWIFDSDAMTLSVQVYDDDGHEYAIPLDDCRTSAEILDWIVQVSRKSWIGPELIGDLVEAFDHLFDLQANVCSWGRESGPIDPANVIREVKRGDESDDFD